MIILFAILGFFAVISAVGNRLLDGFKIIFKFFILLPIIFIVGIWNKKKRKERLKEWGEIKKDFKESSKKIKKRYWIFFICVKILLPLIILGAIIWIKLFTTSCSISSDKKRQKKEVKNLLEERLRKKEIPVH